MCTAIKFGGLFGRTLDLECSYTENVVISPRNFKFKLLHQEFSTPHYAIIGIAHIENGTPLYYDAINERGLGIAGLNFPKKALYKPFNRSKINLASFELIPYLLSKCNCVKNAISELEKINITNDSFSRDLPCTPLHWLIADKNKAITLELTKRGMKIFENPYEVLTNSPDFDFHQTNLSNYMSLSATTPSNTLCPNTALIQYSRGLGGIGLPGDFSSSSRFIRAVFIKNHIIKTVNPVCDFFHIMNSLSVPLGCIITDTHKAVSTIYTSCADLINGIYYYNTYNNQNVKELSLKNTSLDSNEIFYKSIY